MASPPAPKPRQEVLPAKAGGKLTPMERAINRSTFHIDLAACIRAMLLGAAAVVLAINAMIHPESVSVTSAAQVIARALSK